jgi:hypothetical protein
MKRYAQDEKNDARQDVIGRCWTILTTSLHDELFLKLVHVEHGHIATLMAEIRSALLVNIAEDVQPLRLELYGASMQRDCSNDLQTFVAYIIQRKDKLAFLKVQVPDEELAHIFLKGLPSVFQPVQVHFAIPGNKPGSFEGLVEVVRKFAASPIVSAELLKLKSAGLSQNVFSSVSNSARVNHNNNNSSTSREKDRPYCLKFSKSGTCSFGDRCKFYHSTSPQRASGPHSRGQGGGGQDARPISHVSLQECSYCHNKGHTIDVCRKRAARNSAAPISLSLVTEEKLPNPITATTDPAVDDPFEGLPTASDPFCFIGTTGVAERPAGWVFDSGATCCATYDSADCVDISPCQINVTAAGCVFEVLAKGTAIICATDKNGVDRTIRIQNCLISDKFPFKLLALQTFATKGYTVLMEAKTISITNEFTGVSLTARLDKPSQLYFLQENKLRLSNNENHSGVPTNCKLLLAKSYAATTGGDLLWTLHLRHGHKNFKDVCRQYGLPMPKVTPACSSCVMGKSHVHPHLSSGFTRATRTAEGFHSDFRGPFSCPTPFGHIYLLVIIDDFSRRIFAFLVKSQGEWFDIWVKFVTRVEAELGRTNCIAWLLSDNGGVYKSGVMNAFCASKGIQQRFAAPYSQWMDHTSERNMRTIGEMMTTTMLHANFPKKAWGFAALHAADVINRTSESAESNKTANCASNFSRLERWKGTKMPGQTKGLYPFGCLAFKHVPSALRTKLDAHATPMVYLGIDPNSRAFSLGSIYDLAISVSVEVTFFENVFPFRKLKQQESASSLLWGVDPLLHSVDPRLGLFDTAAADSSNVAKLLERDAVKAITVAPTNDALPPSPPAVDVVSPELPEVVEKPVVELRRSSRVSIPRAQTNQRYRVPVAKAGQTTLAAIGDDSTILAMQGECDSYHTILNTITEASLETITPRSAYDALNSPQWPSWKLAMTREKDCHLKNGTFDCCTRAPEGVKTIPADWVYKIKHRGGPIDVNELSEKQFKARVVIRGQYMREGLNFNDTFAPVAKPATLRALLAIATKYKCILKSGDVETAFLTAKMDCEVWVRMPPFWGKDGAPVTDFNEPLPPRLLLKGVPGIPQGSRLFYETFAAHLLALGYVPSLADKCLFINNSSPERRAILIWVDDFIMMHEKENTFTEFIFLLRKKFNIPIVGPLVSFLGMTVTRNVEKRTMSFNQSNSITVLLERAGMLDCNAVSTPCVTGAIFSKRDSPTTAPSNDIVTEYRSLIAMANFISCWSRPDITFTVNKLCKFMSNPGELHWKYLKHLLRYLAGTRNLGIAYNFDSERMGLHGYTDSSFADCPDTSRSTLAYVFLYDNALLSWYSKLNSYVTTCTNHSEYNALALGAKEAEWLLQLLSQLDGGVKHSPVPIMVDNAGVVSMVFNPVDHQSNKHVKIGCHYTRELTSNKVIIPQRVATDQNLADVFTKPLGVTPFKNLTRSFVGETVTMLMMLHQESAPTETSYSSDSDAYETQPAHVSDTSIDTFQRKWPFVSVVSRYLKAVKYDIVDNGEVFSSGRKKLEVVFYGSTIGSGARFIISKHDGMLLESKKGNKYYVCRMTPREEVASSSPDTPATITLKVPQPALTCTSCGIINSTHTAFISCTACKGCNFNWSCGCVPLVDSESKAPSVKIEEPTEKRTSQKKPSLKKWNQQIKYEPPIRRGTTYHHMSCPKLQNTNQADINFANAYDMKMGKCCAEMFV